MTEITTEFEKSIAKVNRYSDLDFALQNLIDVFNFAREVSNEENCEYVQQQLFKMQRNMPVAFLVKTNTKFKYNRSWNDFKNRDIDSFGNEKELLDFIVSTARNYVVYRYSSSYSIDDVDLQGMCAICSKSVREICNRLSVKNKIVKIEPGFNGDYNLFGGFRYHYFNIITINGNDYIVDCSYKQFFDINVSLLEQNGICGMGGSSAGIYMLQHKKRIKTAKELLNKGWVLMDSNNMKNYFDGFAISFRNALYYYDLGCLDYSTNYTANDYENFLFGDDDQGRHEPLEYLGIQKIYVKNPNIIFKTDSKILKNVSE